MINYNTYSMTKNEKYKYGGIGVLVSFIVAYIFYHSLIFSLVVSVIGLRYPKVKTKELLESRKKKLLSEFKDVIYLLSVSLSAGNSVGNAFRKTLKDMKELYNDEQTLMIIELENIVKNIDLNKDVQDLLLDFEKRAGIEDISNFVDVFVTCNNIGGNLNEVIRNTCQIINEKIEIDNDISILLTKKKLEQKIIAVIPIVIMLMLSVTASEYVQPLYKGFMGRAVMTIVIFVVYIAFVISKKIMDIKV